MAAKTTDETSDESYPRRSFMDDPDISWRYGKPDYGPANVQFLRERTHRHAKGSLEEFVENFVKTWEMEVTHKIDCKQWQSVDTERYQVVVNGSKTYGVTDTMTLGTYSLVLAESPLYDVTSHTFDSSSKLFRSAFKDGFPWELLAVLSGPPMVTFTWRHWATMSGPYGDHPATGEFIELFGISIVKVSDDLKVEKVEVFCDPTPFLQKLTRSCPMMPRPKVTRL